MLQVEPTANLTTVDLTTVDPTTANLTTVDPNPSSAADWLEWTEPPTAGRDEEFVNAELPEYEDSNDPGSAMDVGREDGVIRSTLIPVLLELCWLPPRPPSSYDGFNIYVHKDGRRTETDRDRWGLVSLMLCPTSCPRKRVPNSDGGRKYSGVLRRAEGAGDVLGASVHSELVRNLQGQRECGGHGLHLLHEYVPWPVAKATGLDRRSNDMCSR